MLVTPHFREAMKKFEKILSKREKIQKANSLLNSEKETETKEQLGATIQKTNSSLASFIEATTPDEEAKTLKEFYERPSPSPTDELDQQQQQEQKPPASGEPPSPQQQQQRPAAASSPPLISGDEKTPTAQVLAPTPLPTAAAAAAATSSSKPVSLATVSTAATPEPVSFTSDIKATAEPVSVSALDTTPEPVLEAQVSLASEPVSVTPNTAETSKPAPVTVSKPEPVSVTVSKREEPVSMTAATPEKPVSDSKTTPEKPVSDSKATPEEPVSDSKATPEKPVSVLPTTHTEVTGNPSKSTEILAAVVVKPESETQLQSANEASKDEAKDEGCDDDKAANNDVAEQAPVQPEQNGIDSGDVEMKDSDEVVAVVEAVKDTAEEAVSDNKEVPSSEPTFQDLLEILPGLDTKSLTELIQKASLLLAKKL